MDPLSLTELIKQYVYTRQSLSSDPENLSLLQDLCEICIQAGLYRTALVSSERVLEKDPGEDKASAIADAARGALESAADRHCVVASDRSGYLITADRVANRLIKFTHKGERLWVVDREGFEDDALFRPDCLAVDPVGNVFVGSSVLSRVQVFDQNGIFQRVFPVPKKFGKMVRMESFACDEAGNLWVMDSISGLLRLLEPGGDELRTFDLKI